MERIFIPGSRWLFFKLYTGTQSADILLTRHISPFVRRLRKSGAIDDFFFIRYTDPLFHLRLRLHLPDTSRYGEVFGAFYETFQPCVESRLVTTIACDTYVREIERYCEETMVQTERLFCIDSECIVRIMQTLQQKFLFGTYPREEIRWRIGLLLIDDLLEVFNLSLPEKEKFMTDAATAFKTEFGFTVHRATKQLNDKYRLLRNDLYKVLQTRLQDEFPNSILEIRKQQFRQLSFEIKQSVPDAYFPVYLRSLTHMTMNRLFRSQNRLCEMMIYEYLSRSYAALRNRQ